MDRVKILQSRLDTLYIVYDPIAKVLINTSLFRLSELSLFIGILVLSTLVTLADYSGFQAYSQTQEFRQREFTDEPGHPQIYDPNLHAEVVVEGLELPTTMAFLGPNDMLVLEKEKGTVQRIIDGKILPQPLLDVNVAGSIERCMCGIKSILGFTSLLSTSSYLYRRLPKGAFGSAVISSLSAVCASV